MLHLCPTKKRYNVEEISSEFTPLKVYMRQEYVDFLRDWQESYKGRILVGAPGIGKSVCSYAALEMKLREPSNVVIWLWDTRWNDAIYYSDDRRILQRCFSLARCSVPSHECTTAERTCPTWVFLVSRTAWLYTLLLLASVDHRRDFLCRGTWSRGQGTRLKIWPCGMVTIES